jgi:hypothetical protein
MSSSAKQNGPGVGPAAESLMIALQAPRPVVDEAAKAALGSLRNRKLLSFRAHTGDEKPKWRATAMGKAVFTSSLPTHLGEKLYQVVYECSFGSLCKMACLKPLLLHHKAEVKQIERLFEPRHALWRHCAQVNKSSVSSGS